MDGRRQESSYNIWWYGLGKTSFSLYLNAKITKEYQDLNYNRIPIRISLGGLYAKQDLKGLVCSILTGSEGNPSVGNFSYHLFMSMLAEGRFLLILDGFDEMRHAMDENDFSFTFEQMSPFFRGNSKTIILGRPDSFFSDAEETQIFASLMSEIDAKDSDFERVEVSLLQLSQVQSYLERYIGSHSSSVEETKSLNAIKDTVLQRDMEILLRPVQLNMFTRIIRNFSKSDSILTRYRLYFDFIYGFLQREQAKEARKIDNSGVRIGHDDPRSVFMQNVAWWILVVKRENRFHAQEIPRDLIPSVFRKKGAGTGPLREVLVGSVIERTSDRTGALGMKGGSYFYFPHKSYIEFLVAEYFCREKFSREMFAKFFQNINPEIISFVDEGPVESARNIRLGLEHARGTLQRSLFRVASRDPDVAQNFATVSDWRLTQSDIYVHYEHCLRISSEGDVGIEDFIFSVFKNAINSARLFAATQIACERLNRFSSQKLFERLVVNVFEGIGWARVSDIFDVTKKVNLYSDDIASAKIVLLSRCFAYENGRLTLFVRRLWSFAREGGRAGVLLTDYDLDQKGLVTYSADVEKIGFSNDFLDILKRSKVKIPRVELHGGLEGLFGR